LGNRLSLTVVALDSLLLEEAENVVENKVAVRLLSKEEGLNELFPVPSSVAHFANDLNDDTTVG
jgi:hypothetical protein